MHACLIAYPRYLDPITNRPCPVEVALDRLESGDDAKATPLSRLQSMFRLFIPLWRR